jgi:hypothetical protein
VVVCGSRSSASPYRLPKLAEEYEPALPQAAAQIAPGTQVSVNAESVEVPGAKSDRLMLRIKLKF